MCEFYETGLQCKTVKTDWKHVSSSCPRSLVVRALERYSKNRVLVPVGMHVFHINSIISCLNIFKKVWVGGIVDSPGAMCIYHALHNTNIPFSFYCSPMISK